MNKPSSASPKMWSQPTPPARGTRLSSSGSVTLALLSLLALSGCAANQCKPGPVVPPGPDLMQEPPPEGWFRKSLDRILDPSYTGRPTAPTN